MKQLFDDVIGKEDNVMFYFSDLLVDTKPYCFNDIKLKNKIKHFLEKHKISDIEAIIMLIKKYFIDISKSKLFTIPLQMKNCNSLPTLVIFNEIKQKVNNNSTMIISLKMQKDVFGQYILRIKRECWTPIKPVNVNITHYLKIWTLNHYKNDNLKNEKVKSVEKTLKITANWPRDTIKCFNKKKHNKYNINQEKPLQYCISEIIIAFIPEFWKNHQYLSFALNLQFN